ncbi:galactose-binding domain-containing protein [Paenibacillus roseipurpureus]|uniref:Discoidin domain-containing protein n=1 Tax=Paenibacillus roseopurpureus TaxID=2918901 RepID=A0AA96LQS3_9BACL|nr:discoidin domain-containing protein [Paenibacillus sp. MBLB1832]WNR45548.1 discoidin domain-containing protein [Paenibacillus sp. MBLB1832]
MEGKAMRSKLHWIVLGSILLITTVLGLMIPGTGTTALAASSAQVIPPNAGYVNVKDFGAMGDGVADDTAAIMSAIKSRNRYYGYPMNVYFPAGVYLVSDTINGVNPDGTDNAHLTLQGAGQGQTIIRLKNNAPGFNAGAVTAKPVVRFAGESGIQNQAFMNFLFDLTVDIGSQNPQAIGVDYLTSNQGSMRNVDIVSGDGQGYIGLAMTREIGPGMVKNISITGFQYGIKTAKPLYSMVLEKVTLKNQSVAGILNERQMLEIRNLTSTNKVPAIINRYNDAMVTIIDSQFFGGIKGESAIRNESGGSLLARNLNAQSSYYSQAITNEGVAVSGKIVTEYNSDYLQRLFQSRSTTLNLPIEETPELPQDPLSDWAFVDDYGANPDDNIDDTAAIQAAIDSGKTTIYFRPRHTTTYTYQIQGTLVIRGNVKRLAGMGTYIKKTNATSLPQIRIETTNYPNVFIDRLFGDFQVTHVGATHVVSLDNQWNDYHNEPGSGDLYLEDTYSSFVFNGNKAWMRQANSESKTNTQLVNQGGTVWVLGLKTEWMNTTARTTGGGKSEIMGAFMYPAQGNVAPTTPAFETIDSQASYQYGVFDDWVQQWTLLFRETRNGETRDMLADDLVEKRTGRGTKVNLYTAIPEPLADVTPPSTPKLSLKWNSLNAADLYWVGSTDDVHINGYMLYRDGYRVADTKKREIIDTHLDATLPYTYTVFGYDDMFNLSAPSNAISNKVGWGSEDIGTVTKAGYTEYADNSFHVYGAGSDIGGTADSFHYTYTPLYGDGSLVFKLVNQSKTSQEAQEGIMIRDTLAPDAKFAGLFRKPWGPMQTVTRNETGGTASVTSLPGSQVLPFWMKLTRSGNTVTVYKSTDGVHWGAPIQTFTLALDFRAYVGLAIASDFDGITEEARVSNVNVETPSQYLNLALKKPASQAGTSNDAAAKRAVDGNTNGKLASGSVTQTLADHQAWWQVDFQETGYIRSVDIYNRTDSGSDVLKNYYVFVSDTPFSSEDPNVLVNQPGVWSSLQTAQAGSPTSLKVDHQGRYLRIQLQGDGKLTLAEVVAMGYGSIIVDVEPPTAPSGLSVVTKSETTATIGWLPATDNRGVTSYLIYRDGALVGTVSGSVYSFTDTGLNPGDEVNYAIIAQDVYENVSPTSAVLKVIVPVNIAKNKTAKMSSTQSGRQAFWAVDGISDGSQSASSISQTLSENEAWWEVDLGAVRQIDRIQLFAPTDCCQTDLSNYYVFVSDTPFTVNSVTYTLNQPNVWSKLQVGALSSSPADVQVGHAGRYVRIQLTSSSASLGLAEVRVIGELPLVNAALNKAATQSSTSYNAYASKAVDGNSDGNWNAGSVSHTSTETNAWWQVDLGSVQDIHDIQIYNRTDCCGARLSSYYVFVSNAPFGSTNVASTLADPNVWNSFQSEQAGSPTKIRVGRTGRYVRIQLNQTNPLAIAEVKVMKLDDIIVLDTEAPTAPSGLNVVGKTETSATISWSPSTDNRGVTGYDIYRDNTLLGTVAGNVNVFTATGLTAGDSYSYTVKAKDASLNVSAASSALQVTQLINMAKNKPATMSSTQNGASASRAVDGNTDGNLASGSVSQSLGEKEAWWQVDLGAVRNIDRIQIFGRTDCCTTDLSQYYVFVSDTPFTVTGVTYTLSQPGVWSQFQSAAAGLPTEVQVGRTGRYVRIQLTGQSSSLSLAEVKVLGTLQQVNVALNKPATQSSTSYNAYASRAVDGNSDGNWNAGSVSHTSTEANAWWQVDLGSVQDIHNIQVFNRTDCCGARLSEYYVFVSDTPFSTTDLNATLSNANVWNSFQSGQAGSPTKILVGRTGRYIRIQLKNTNPLAIAEVKVMALQ